MRRTRLKKSGKKVWVLLGTWTLKCSSASQSFELTAGKAQSVWGRMFCFEWVSTGLTAMNLNKLLSSVLLVDVL